MLAFNLQLSPFILIDVNVVSLNLSRPNLVLRARYSRLSQRPAGLPWLERPTSFDVRFGPTGCPFFPASIKPIALDRPCANLVVCVYSTKRVRI